MVLCLGESPRRFLSCWLSFSLVDALHFVVVLLLLFDIIPHPSVYYRRSFYTPFYTLSPLHRKVIRDTFICSTVSFLPRALQPWVGIFYPQASFTLPSFPTFLAQPAFIKVCLGADSSSLKFARFHTDFQNTDPAHLFVWFAVIHNPLYILNLYLYMSMFAKIFTCGGNFDKKYRSATTLCSSDGNIKQQPN